MFGVVTDGFAYSDLVTPMHAVIGADGDPAAAAGAEPSASRRDSALHRRRAPADPRGAAAAGAARLGLARLRRRRGAGAADGRVHHRGERPTGIPVGLYAPAGSSRRSTSTAISCSGPRPRTSTSPASPASRPRPARSSSCCASIFQTFPPPQGVGRRRLLQRQGPRPLLPRPAGRPSATRTAGCTRRLGLRPEPFARVSATTRRSRPMASTSTPCARNEALAANTQPLVWGLREVLDYAEVVLNRDDVDAKADAFIDFLAERVVGREYQDDMLRGAAVHGAELRRPRGVLPRDLRLHGGAGEGRRGLEDPPRRHHPEGAQPPEQHLDAVQGPGHRRRRRQRPAVGRVHGPQRPRGGRGRPRSAGAGPGLRPRRLQAARASRAPGPRRRSRRGVRGRAQQVRPGRRPGHLRAQDAARPLRARAGTWAWCCSRPSSSAPRCSAGWWATPAPACTAAWTWTSSRRRATPRSRPPPRSSSRRCPRAS